MSKIEGAILALLGCTGIALTLVGVMPHIPVGTGIIVTIVFFGLAGALKGD